MSELHIVCQNCGAKYKLPESFQGDKAKCKACGATIDVAAQRQAAASAPAAAVKPAAEPKPAAAKAAAPKAETAKPASVKPASAKARPAEARAKPAEARPRRGAAAAAATADEDSNSTARGGRSRRGAEKPAKKGGMNPLVLGGSLAGIAVVVVVLVFVLGGGDDKAGQGATEEGKVAQNDPAAPAAGAQTAGSQAAGSQVAGSAAAGAGKPAEASSEKPAETPAEKPADANAEKPAESAAEKPAEKPAAKPAEKPKPAVKEITSKSEVFDPKTLEPLSYPESIPQARRDELESLVADIDGTASRAAKNAKNQLREAGWQALFGLVNRLRNLDYTTADGTRDGYELNQLLSTILDGTNVGFRPLQGDEPPLNDMDFNARTVSAWQRMLAQFPDEEAFKTWKKNKAAKRKDD